jgi:hypothetical protein
MRSTATERAADGVRAEGAKRDVERRRRGQQWQCVPQVAVVAAVATATAAAAAAATATAAATAAAAARDPRTQLEQTLGNNAELRETVDLDELDGRDAGVRAGQVVRPAKGGPRRAAATASDAAAAAAAAAAAPEQVGQHERAVE